MKVLLVGPLPDPVDGCSYANQVLVQALRGRGHSVETVDTAARVFSGQHGRYSLKKALVTKLQLLPAATPSIFEAYMFDKFGALPLLYIFGIPAIAKKGRFR